VTYVEISVWLGGHDDCFSHIEHNSSAGIGDSARADVCPNQLLAMSCSRHRWGKPATEGPAFPDRYPVEDLVEALAEGIRTAHPAMPEFELNDAQIHDLIAYLKSLER
jgi:uncharacterized protein (DUF433 family)